MKKEKNSWLVKWKRPFDDNWLYHIPSKLFKDEIALIRYLQMNATTPGVEFKIVQKLS